MTRLHRISIIVDSGGRPEGCTVTTDYDERHARHRPMDVGPFDTVEEVLGAAMEGLDIQLSLWDLRT